MFTCIRLNEYKKEALITVLLCNCIAFRTLHVNTELEF